MYGLSESYNLLNSRSPEEKANKKSVVLFISDGNPNPSSGALSSGGKIIAFYNLDENITKLADAIKAKPEEMIDGPALWPAISGGYQRHDVNPSILAKDDTGNIIGAYGQNTEIITVGYMLNLDIHIQRLTDMATTDNDYINIPANAKGTSVDYLTEQILQGMNFPGGRNAVLRDEISEYYYIPEGAVLPENVTVEGSIEEGQTIVWNIGDILHYAKTDEPTIKIPLVLKEEYRDVPITTYYPTNNDYPEPDLTTPDSGPDGEDTGQNCTILIHLTTSAMIQLEHLNYLFHQLLRREVFPLLKHLTK